MNVLFHHRTRGQDVEAVHIRGISGALRSFGHRVDVVSPPGVHVAAAPLPPALPSTIIPLFPVAPVTAKAPTIPKSIASRGAARPSPWRLLAARAPEAVFEGLEVAYNAYAWLAMNAQLSRRPYGLVYDRYALFSMAPVLAARRHGVPSILEVNDSAVLDRMRPLRLLAAARRVERFIWGAADAIVTVSSYFRDLIVEAGVDRASVFVIPNAVNGADFHSLPSGEGVRSRLGLSGKLVVGYVGAVNRWRRLDLLIDACAALAPNHPDLHLLIVGDGADREAIEADTLRRGLASRVSFTGRVAHADVASYLAATDLTVIPHSNDYGSPMKMFECMAAGKLVVAPWLPPIVSVLGEDDGGVLFAPLDPGALAQALEALIRDPARRALLGARAREKVLSDYVWHRHAETILDIRARVLSVRS